MISTKLIAEIGLNHCGDINRAINLINKAINSGADYIKFQYFKSENLFNFNEYKKLLNLNDIFNNKIDKLLLNDQDFIKTINYCITNNIRFGISFFSKIDIINISNLYYKIFEKNLFSHISFLKIASGEVNDVPLLEEYLKISLKFNIPILISVGATSDSEISFLLKFFKKIKNNIVLLHCRIKYPADFDNFNLCRIEYLRKKFKVKTGLSDHSIGIEIPLLSLKYKPEFIEKHFTDSREIKQADNPISSNEDEFRIIKNFILKYDSINGDGKFNLLENEKNELKYARKGIYLNKNKQLNEKIDDNDIITLRPNLFFNDAFNYKRAINKKLKNNKDILSPLDIKNDIK
ncbi:MAG: N-acetylneuraminate synthase family protein [Spirochaetes bacterium]|nr:N-acetylneuraminate synthase family protein [Spirochaetota bacterium]